MAAGCYPQFYTFAIFDIYWHIEDTYVYPRINLHAYISKDAQDIGFQTLWPWHLFSRLSNIKGEGRVELTGSGFLFVPHSNYGSPMHPDLTIHFVTDDRHLDDSNMRPLLRILRIRVRSRKKWDFVRYEKRNINEKKNNNPDSDLNSWSHDIT